MSANFDSLKLENDISFPIYVASKEIIKRRNSFLEELNLTYTQYIVMEVLWERCPINLKELGKIIYLDSGTLTPVLKALESKGYITRTRSSQDERVLNIDLTEAGIALKEGSLAIPELNNNYYNLTEEEFSELKRLLLKIVSCF